MMISQGIRAKNVGIFEKCLPLESDLDRTEFGVMFQMLLLKKQRRNGKHKQIERSTHKHRQTRFRVKQSQRQLGLHGPPTLFNFFEFNVVRKPHYAIAHTRKL